MSSHVLFFRSFLKQLSTQQLAPKFYSHTNTIQSSVGLIFKIFTAKNYQNVEDIRLICQNPTPETQISLLFTQRSGHEQDSNKYNVVFPGGQAEPIQNDFDACKREVYQQIGLPVDEKCIYLGSLPKNFYYAKKRNKDLMITCHIWVLQQKFLEFEPVLNKDELIAYRWVPLTELIDPSNLREYQQKQLTLFKRMGVKYPKISEYLKQNIVMMRMTGMDIKLDRDLWGLTLWVWSYILQMGSHNICERNLKDTDKESLNKKVQASIQMIRKVQIQFKPGFIFARPLNYIALAWYKKNRIQQFQYPQTNSRPSILYWVLLAALLIFIFTIA